MCVWFSLSRRKKGTKNSTTTTSVIWDVLRQHKVLCSSCLWWMHSTHIRRSYRERELAGSLSHINNFIVWESMREMLLWARRSHLNWLRVVMLKLSESYRMWVCVCCVLLTIFFCKFFCTPHIWIMKAHTELYIEAVTWYTMNMFLCQCGILAFATVFFPSQHEPGRDWAFFSCTWTFSEFFFRNGITRRFK